MQPSPGELFFDLRHRYRDLRAIGWSGPYSVLHTQFASSPKYNEHLSSRTYHVRPSIGPRVNP